MQVNYSLMTKKKTNLYYHYYCFYYNFPDNEENYLHYKYAQIKIKIIILSLLIVIINISGVVQIFKNCLIIFYFNSLTFFFLFYLFRWCLFAGHENVGGNVLKLKKVITKRCWMNWFIYRAATSLCFNYLISL